MPPQGLIDRRRAREGRLIEEDVELEKVGVLNGKASGDMGTWGHDSALPKSFRHAKMGQMPPHQNNGVFLRSGSGRKMLGK